MGFFTPFRNALQADFQVWAVDAIPADEVAEAEGDREETGDTWTPVSYTRHALLGPGARDAAPGARAADGESASVAELLAVYEGHAQQVCGCPGCSSSASRSPTAPDGSAWSDYATNDAQVGAATQFGNDYVDGILYGTRWTGPLTYSFADSVADFGSPYPYTIGGLQQVTATQQAATRAIFEGVSVGNTFAYGSYADVANIAIALAANPFGPSDIVIAEADTLDGANIPTARVVDFPELDQRISGGDVLYGNDTGIYRTPLPGNFAWATHIHEYGHALGLSHGHNGGGSIFDRIIPADRNSEEFSIMTYASVPNDFVTNLNNEQFGHPQTLMQLDLLALQHLYGANYSTNSGNTTYTWSPTTGQMFINGVGQGLPGGGHVDANKIFLTVWDGGGADTYNLSNYTTNMHLDLTPGGWSRVSDAQTAVRHITQQVVGVQPFEVHQASGNIYNAYMFNGDQRSLIENATGGTGNDWIEGNIADNLLRGGAGNDTLNGREGDDRLEGGASDDTLFGDGRTGGPAYNGPAYLQLPFNTLNNSVQSAFDLTPYVGRQSNPDVRDSSTHPHISVDVTGNNNGQDFFQIFVPGPGLLVLDIDYGTSQGFNGYMALFNTAGALMAASDESGVDTGSRHDLTSPQGDRGSEDPHIVYNVTQAGFYLINIDDHIGRGVYSGVGYRLSITLPNFDETPGSEGDDLLIGGDGDDRLFGQGGDDVLIGGTGADALTGGAGTDTADYSGSTGRVTVSLMSGTGWYGHAAGDTLSGIEDVIGSAFDDSLKGSNGANRLEGGDGIDTLDGQGGGDTLDGGAGDDVLIGGAGADTLIGGSGVDTADYSGSAVRVTISLGSGNGWFGDAAGDTFSGVENLIGSAFDDSLKGSGGANRLEGGDGDDTLDGLNGDDVLVGGAGADRLIGGDGIDTADYSGSTSRVTVSLISGNGWYGHAAGDTFSGVESLIGSAFDDSLKGSNGANRLEGGDGTDTLDGQGGNDVLIGGAGADRLLGGGGIDTADYSASAGRVTISLASGNGWNGDAAGDTFNGVEDLVGSAFDDSLKGTGSANRLEGGDGDDTLDGLGGDDVLLGGAGADRLLGGAGIDTADYSGSTGRVTVSLASGTGWYGHAASDTLSDVENLVGSAFNDSLKGTAAANRLEGGAGDDTLDGQSGDDVLIGGAGNDRMVGGGGNDRFVFGNGVGDDTITDFIAGAGTPDAIDLSANSLLNAFADVLTHSSQSGLDTLINLGGGDLLTLLSVTRTNLHQDDFVF